MPIYTAGECAGCCSLSSREARRIAIDNETGWHRGRFRVKSRTYRTVRPFYRKKEAWLCSDCVAASAEQRRERRTLIGAIGGIGLIALTVSFFATNGMTRKPSDKRPQIALRLPHPEGSNSSSAKSTFLYTSQTSSASSERTGSRSPLSLMPDTSPQAFNPNLSDVSNATRIQARLADLGYLGSSADGRWGPRSRAALRAFKRSNGLAADDKWDNATANQLFGANVIRAPIDPSSAALAISPRGAGAN
jgi:hypothetical protein